MKDKIEKEYPRRTRKLLETKLSCRNLIKGINAWAVLLVRYSGPFLKWTRDELKQMDQSKRKLITIYKALRPRDDVDRLYIKKRERKWTRKHWKQRWRIDAMTQGLHKKVRRKIITITKRNTNETGNDRAEITRKQKWEEHQLYGCFKRLTNDI